MIKLLSRMEKYIAMSKPSKLRVTELSTKKPTRFDLLASEKLRKEIAAKFELINLPKLRFFGEISTLGDTDWVLNGDLGATVVQSCVISLKDVRTRIDTKVTRQFLADFTFDEHDDETEMVVSEDSEALGVFIDLERIMIEALLLALPDYPKAEDANLEQSTFSEQGVTPMQDEDARPFAALSALRDQLGKKNE